MKSLIPDNFYSLSDKTQDVLIRLNYFTGQVYNLWFWHQWLRTEEWAYRMSDLRESLRETREITCDLKGEELKTVQEIFNKSAQIYQNKGGEP